ncbi:MAG: SEC-C metal-binding domain-containing protein [Terriglobia bacterium]
MDIQRYERLRQVSRRLMLEVTKTIPREAYEEMGKALGILRNNTFVLDSMDVSSVLMDACVFDWIRNGQNLVEIYFEAHPPAHGTDERLVSQAYCRAKYRVLMPETMRPGAVTYWTNLLSREPIALMDVGLSQTVAHGFRGLLATRTAVMGDWWMTTGAGLPISDRKTGEMVLEMIRRRNLLQDTTSVGEHRLAIGAIRACLDSGVAGHVRYLGADDEEEDFVGPRLITELRSPRCHIDRNDPCPCGSGKRYRRCCGRK